MPYRRLVPLLFLLLTACSLFRPAPRLPEREFRGVWLTTVNNADWPSRQGLSTEQQKDEMRTLLDCISGTFLNAVIFHVRPNSDALYDSKIEPWSDYLSGELGKAPEPYYDPLAYAVEEAHKRGLELHAWLNPYRTRNPLTIPASYRDHMAVKHPEYVRQYGRYWWYDPGEPEVRANVVEIVRDIVRRYDADAIHFDDYFYPYPEDGVDFPDEPSWQKYLASGGKLLRDDWRRHNVDLLIQEVDAVIKAEKPKVRFGVSPFGIWRPGHPRSVRGLDAYSRIYADSKKWMQSGWVDYIAPQLYWSRSAPEQRFAHLLRWWQRQNRRDDVDLWPGLGAHRVANGRANQVPAEEIVEQIRELRAARADGWILFTSGVLLRNRGGLTDKLRELNEKPVPTP